MTTFWNLPYPSQRAPVLADNVVATSQPLAAQAGLDALRAGGSAVDAALTAAITLTVVEPTATGLGSDAFAIVWDGRKLRGLNGSGRAPAALGPERFTGRESMPETGWDAVTVPGAVDTWTALWERYGRLPFARLFEAAVGYAENGFPVSPRVAGLWSLAVERYRGMRGFESTFLPGGRSPEPGERFRNPDLAATLAHLAEHGTDTFYRGELAARIAACAAGEGGLLTADDLAGHRSEWVPLLETAYRDVVFHEIPPNGQGIAALIALGILRHTGLADAAPDSADSVHWQVEAMKQAFQLVFRHVADPDRMRIRTDELLADGFLAERARSLRADRAREVAGEILRGGGTVYVSAADRSGQMVSFIQSNYTGFGSGVVIPGTGIALQNRGAGFSLRPGHPNEVRGGRRPFHTIIPGFATRGGRPLLCFGVMGMHMQPQGHVQMAVRLVDQGMNPQAAADAPRWHVNHDFTLALEPGFPPETVRELENRGHRIVSPQPETLFGGAQLVMRRDGGYIAASDPRKDGLAAGF